MGFFSNESLDGRESVEPRPHRRKPPTLAERPHLGDETWRIFFEGYELGHSNDGVARDDVDQDAARAQASVTRLVDAYREIGHYLADLDPLDRRDTEHCPAGRRLIWQWIGRCRGILSSHCCLHAAV